MGASAATIASDEATLTAFWINLIAGSLAAAPAAILATPPDVIKTRMQQAKEPQDMPFDDPLVTQQGEKTSAIQVFKNILEEEGPQVLFSGCMERVVRSAPQFGVTLAVFDVLNSVAVDRGWM